MQIGTNGPVLFGNGYQKNRPQWGKKKGSRNYMKNRRISGVSKETYKVYDENGEFKRLIEKAEERTLTEKEWLKGVTCFVINEKGEVLIEVRANKGLTPGKKDLCSGHLDDKETETQAMIRELKEELGIGLEEAMNVWLPLEEAFALIKSGRTKFPKDYDYSKIFEKVKEIYYGEKDIQRGEQI